MQQVCVHSTGFGEGPSYNPVRDLWASAFDGCPNTLHNLKNDHGPSPKHVQCTHYRSWIQTIYPNSIRESRGSSGANAKTEGHNDAKTYFFALLPGFLSRRYVHSLQSPS